MSFRRDGLVLAGLALVVAGIAVLGLGARATYGAQTTADEPQYLLSALSLWEDGDLDIADELADQRYRDFHQADLPRQTRLLDDGRQISPHDPLLPILLAVPMGLGGWMAAKATLAVLGGVLAALMAWTMITRFGVSRVIAVSTAALFAFAPPLAVYSTQVYPEIAASIALLAGFAAVTGDFGPRARVVFVVSVIALPWLAVKFVPLAAVLAVGGIVKAGKGRRIGLLSAIGAAGALYILGHVDIYGGLTAYATGDHFVGGEFTAMGTDLDLWGRSSRLIGLLVDRGFGIAAWQPAYLIAPFVGAWAVSQRLSRFDLAAALVGTGWLVATFVALTMHGWWFPGRQVVVVLPILVVVIGAWADDASKPIRAGFWCAGALGVVAFGFLVAEGVGQQLTWVVDFGATANPVYQTLSGVMPDYMDPTILTWVLHGFWVSIAVLLGWLGWRIGSVRRMTSRVQPQIENEGVLT